MGVSFRFIHAADLHVDSPFRGLAEAPPHVREALQSSTFQAVRNLVETALREKVDFVVVSGDLYDTADRSLRAQLTLQREWQQLHAQGVRLFVIHGNHDPLSGGKADLAWPESVHFFGADKVSSVPAYTRSGSLAAYVHGISYGTRAVTANLASGYKPANMEGVYQIALLHGNVDGHAGHDPYAPCSLQELVGAGFHYWALGHIHQRAVLHTYPHVVYAGNTQGRHAKETGAKGCYLVDVSASHETKLQFIPLDAVRWETLRVSIEGLAAEQSLMDELERTALDALERCEGRPLVARVCLEGRGQLHGQLTNPGFALELLDGLRERIRQMEGPASLAETPWCWISGLAAETGAELDLAVLSEEDSFIGELLRGSYALEVDELQVLLGEALQPLSAQARLRKLVRSLQEEHAQLWLQQAREIAAGLLIEDAAPQREEKRRDETGQSAENRHDDAWQEGEPE
ncbi:metallophosphoesterase family protein [Paenibacillus montanisoli]|uniref:DNA repair exonuclease n=1 Tax=Paenibacillus montanisoli TaxID=2081970 RepID=A0A328U584_9BACL|nr:DNA repair exonuclease [Paenibacillus montanisoli]RAP78008.1 DNA repair exonuclease [Paenibacillus montanisoli]